MNLPVCNIIGHVGVGMARDRYYREVVAESPDRTHYHGFEDQFCGFHRPSIELNLDVFCTGPCNFHKNVEGYSTHVFECAHWLHTTSFLHIPNSNYSNIIHIHCFWHSEYIVEEMRVFYFCVVTDQRNRVYISLGGNWIIYPRGVLWLVDVTSTRIVWGYLNLGRWILDEGRLRFENGFGGFVSFGGLGMGC